MDAIIFADRQGEELSPFNQFYRPAMLPLLGKPLLQHALEQLQCSGVTRVFIIVDDIAASVRSLFNNGERWSMTVRYVYRRAEQSYHSAIAACISQLEFPLVAMRGDIVFKHWLAPIESSAGLTNQSSVCKLLLNADELDQLNTFCWDTIVTNLHAETDDFYPLTSLHEVHSVLSLSVTVQDKVAIDHGHAINTSTYLGANSHVPLKSINKGHLYVASQSQVSDSASLHGNCYLGDNVIVANHANVTNSIIFDNTCIGQGASIENALVCGNWLYRADMQLDCYIDDPLILSNIESHTATPWIERGIALMMFLTLLPCALLIAILQLAKRQPVFTVMNIETNLQKPLDGQFLYQQKQGKILNSQWHWLKRFPLLLLVIIGQLRLTGRDPLIATSHSVWQQTINQLPKGLFSRAQYAFQRHGNIELYELHELENAARPSLCSR